MKSERSRESMPNQSLVFEEKLVPIDPIYAQMVVDAIMVNAEMDYLRKKIDESLDKRDMVAFMTLSQRYRELNR
ncbi:IDEAL domain-containing protein [Caenibacillus caldisaponilyticus]|jgi:uncharacterized protein YpiB (UPF0302 family)|uniref:IDEAL domain-containing protein n=1 Tax=Caenibacillus caldisaponilyticus TaxID=1674942 RepID=UPI00098860CB|nr:IDEAL domain-containing protein [Caenibacillus caldisaponilyticus]